MSLRDTLACMRSLLFALALTATAATAQSFDVASVRENPSGYRYGEPADSFDPLPGGRFTATNCSLKVLLGYAFDVQWFLIKGIPEKLRSKRFDITAKLDNPKPNMQHSEYPPLVEHLLEERLGLRAHWETRESPVLFLVVDKPGKLHPARYGDCSTTVALPGTQSPELPSDFNCGGMDSSPGNAKGYSLTASDIAGNLSWFQQTTIIDHTGLTGKYDVKLRWTPDPEHLMGAPAVTSDAPSFATALREQLGLKLESGKGPVKFLVVDRLEQPSEN
jgi:uncharacterized protein (TIGR03435 family)